MKTNEEIEAACERAAVMQNEAQENGSKLHGMSYEQGLRDALDWVCGNIKEDPTEQN